MRIWILLLAAGMLGHTVHGLGGLERVARDRTRHAQLRRRLDPLDVPTRSGSRLGPRSANGTLPTPPSPLPTSAPSPLPTPLDESISSALSTPCITYLTSLLSSSAFQQCVPFSLLLTTSSAYSALLATAVSSGNYTALNALVAYTAAPQPRAETCVAYMRGVAAALESTANCAPDIASGTPVALKTQRGVGNYQVMMRAEALVDPESGVYCYLEAVASTEPDDLYLWKLPGGISLPASSAPTCSKCSAMLVDTYEAFLQNTTTLNATIMTAAADRINDACGTSFVTLAGAATSAAGPRAGGTRRALGLGVGALGMLSALGVAGLV